MRDAITYASENGCEVVLAVAKESMELAAGVRSESLLLPSSIIMEATPNLGMSNAQTVLSMKLIEHVGFSIPLGDSGEDQRFYTQAVEAFRLANLSEGDDPGAVISERTNLLAEQDSGAGVFRINYNGQPASFHNVTLWELNSTSQMARLHLGVVPPARLPAIARDA